MPPQRANAHSPARLALAAPHKWSECLGECTYLCRRARALPMACSRPLACTAVAAAASQPAGPPALQRLPSLPAAPVACVRFILRALLSGAVLAGWSGRPAARRDSRRTSVIAPSAQSSRCQTLPLRQGSSRCAAGTGPVQRTSPGCETGGGRDVRRLAGPTCGQASSKSILGSGLWIEGAGELQNAVLQC